MSEKIYPVAVIGGGSAGVMATLRCVLNNDEVLFFPGSAKDKKKSRALWVRKIENMPGHFGYKRGIEDPNLETLKWIEASAFAAKLHWMKNTGVVHIKKNENEIFEVQDSKGVKHLCRFVILCTGVMDVQPEINGSIEGIFDYANAQTADYCLRCDGHHTLGKKTAILGHNNGAAWVAIMLHERYAPPSMTILTNGKKADIPQETHNLLTKYKIKVIENTINAIQGQDKGFNLQGFILEDGSLIEAEMSFIALGMIVYNELAIELGAELDPRGFVKGDASGATSVTGLYVAGDLKANTKKQIYTAWDNAVDAADTINQKIRVMQRESLG